MSVAPVAACSRASSVLPSREWVRTPVRSVTPKTHDRNAGAPARPGGAAPPRPGAQAAVLILYPRAGAVRLRSPPRGIPPRRPIRPPRKRSVAGAAGPAEPEPAPPSAEEEAERAKLSQVSKRLEKTARYFKSLGTLGFWSQLVCTTVSAGILSFSAVATGNATSPFTFYATALGIVAAFISVFRSFGYICLSERLGRTATEPAKAPPRADVVNNLRNSIVLNVIGMGASVLGMQATVGALVAKALTTSSVPYYQGISAGQSPVLALDVFLVQASANTILSHFLGLSSSLELLRSVTVSQAGPGPAPRPA